MPTGYPIRRREEDGFRRDYVYQRDKKANEWLTWCAKEQRIRIQHRENGPEKEIGAKAVPVDGFFGSMVFQFQGCFFHGHKCHLTEGKWDGQKFGKYTMEERAQHTADTTTYIKAHGYRVVEMYECEWGAMKKNSREIQNHCATLNRPTECRPRMTQYEIVKAIKEGKLFGMAEVDIKVPDELKDKYSEFPPIFKTASVGREDIGDHMKAHAEARNELRKPRKCLISSMNGEKLLLATPLLRWYLDHGLEITRVYQVIEYTPVTCFKDFVGAVSDARRAGDRDVQYAIVAETMKLMGNAAYGKTITNKQRHLNVKYCGEHKTMQHVASPFFRRLEHLGDDFYEVENAKKSIKEDLPSHIGFFVYQYAKLRMLQYYHDFLDKYIDPTNFELVEMDTDSLYLALSKPTLEEVIRPEMMVEFLKDQENWFPNEATPELAAYHKRTPGLFKVEWKGEAMWALNSKCYLGVGEKNKIAVKGVQKSRNADILVPEKFEGVLDTGEPVIATNRGFRVRNNDVWTYEMKKKGLTYLYVKRKVLADGVHTVPLDI